MLARIKQSVPYIRFRRWQKALRRQLKLPAYRGTAYRCPICGTGLRAFKPVWKSYRREVARYGCVHPVDTMETLNLSAYSCPCCDSSDRERLTALHLERAFRDFDPARRYSLIEFAPASALAGKIKTYPFIAYRSADLVRTDVDERIDLTDMPGLADASVDVFLCSHILEHIPDDRKAMRELRRILKPDGFGIVLVPLFPHIHDTHEDPAITSVAERWKYFGMGDHVRQYGKADFIRRLEQAGFQVEPLGVDHFGAENFEKAGIAQNSVLYVVRPSA